MDLVWWFNALPFLGKEDEEAWVRAVRVDGPHRAFSVGWPTRSTVDPPFLFVLLYSVGKLFKKYCDIFGHV
jgi:hypothetical protein